MSSIVPPRGPAKCLRSTRTIFRAFFRACEGFQSRFDRFRVHRDFHFQTLWLMFRMSDPRVDGRSALSIRFCLAQNFSGHGGNVTLTAQNVVEEV
jgi:hypothetical protein